MDVVRDAVDAVGVALGWDPSQSDEPSACPTLLNAADAASGERVMHTLSVRRLRKRLPFELVSDIARHGGAPAWQLGFGPMTPPRTAPIEAADARAARRHASTAQARSAGALPQ